MIWSRMFNTPVYANTHLDHNSDTVHDLIVVTMAGIHILQVFVQRFIDFLPIGF